MWESAHWGYNFFNSNKLTNQDVKTSCIKYVIKINLSQMSVRQITSNGKMSLMAK